MIPQKSLVFGLLDTSQRIENQTLSAKLRSFTISWIRYCYHGPILEGPTIADILAQAANRDYDYCLIQAPGHIIIEPWTPAHWNCIDYHQALAELMDRNDFTVIGEGGAPGVPHRDANCLLVNVRRWGESNLQFDRIQEAGPTDCVQDSTFPAVMQQRTLSLLSKDPEQNRHFAQFLDQALDHFDPQDAHAPLSADQRRFLQVIRRHTQGAQRGVFLWNVESYRDIAEPCSGVSEPVGTLFCVAAGFKPNMILKTHGFDAGTRVVFFDYSAQALAFRKLMKDEWDGDDYPRFLEYALRKMRPPETFFHLWNDRQIEDITAADFREAWEAELERWGGAQILKDHWREYRQLKHEFVHCNVLSEPHKLFDRIETGAHDVIWWSNAFFTVFSNWFHTVAQRRAIYDVWVEGLAQRNPDLHLYGFDYNNIGVNGIQADDYAELYFRGGRDYLNPLSPKLQIRC